MHSQRTPPHAGHPARRRTPPLRSPPRCIFFDAEGTLWIERGPGDAERFWADPRVARADACFVVTPGARELLTTLRRLGLHLVVVSRHHPHLLRQLLDHFRLSRFFDDVLVNGDKGLRIWGWLQERGYATAEAVMVGDRYDLDVAPAEAVGVRAYLIDRPDNQGQPAARRLHTLGEIHSVVTSSDREAGCRAR